MGYVGYGRKAIGASRAPRRRRVTLVDRSREVGNKQKRAEPYSRRGA